MADQRLRLGIDLGGTKVAAGAVDRTGELVGVVALVHDGTLTGVLQTVRRCLAGLRDNGIGQPFVSAGVGVPGAVDGGGWISLCPALPDLEAVDLAEALSDLLGVTAYVENDSNAAALGEHHYGEHEVDDLACVCLGTGIGLGVVSGGCLVRGAYGLAAEIADLDVDDGDGRRVRTEDVVQARALAQAAGRADKSAMPQVLTDHQQGDPAAIAAVTRYVTVVTNAILATAVLFDPAVVLLSGGLGSHPVIADQVRTRVQQRRSRLRVAISRYGAHAPLVGAAALPSLDIESDRAIRLAR